MKTGMKISIILFSIVLFWGSVFYFAGCSDNPKDRAIKLAGKALRATVANPGSIKIIGVSKADSVFGRTYITPKEQTALSVAMMKISERVMKETDGLENFDPDNKETWNCNL